MQPAIRVTTKRLNSGSIATVRADAASHLSLWRRRGDGRAYELSWAEEIWDDDVSLQVEHKPRLIVHADLVYYRRRRRYGYRRASESPRSRSAVDPRLRGRAMVGDHAGQQAQSDSFWFLSTLRLTTASTQYSLLYSTV